MKELNLIPPEILPQLEKNIQQHDQSKYSSEEFNGYRKRFYPINDAEKFNSKAEFSKAWEHHKLHNPHHWESPQWYDSHRKMAIKAMQPVYVYEMVCDWQAMSLKLGGNCLKYYQNTPYITIAPETKTLLIPLLEAVSKAFPEH